MEIPNSNTYYMESKRMERSTQDDLPEDKTSELRPELHHGISSKIWDKSSEAVKDEGTASANALRQVQALQVPLTMLVGLEQRMKLTWPGSATTI